MKDTRLLDRFNEAKQILCRYDYYIHIPKKILHLTNTELKIPHLMGLQYIAGEGMFEGDRGAYMIKSGRLQYNSITKLVRKYYKKAEKQESITAMVYGKIDNLARIREMLETESFLYLYDITANPELKLKTDYLLVNQQPDVVLLKMILRLNVKFGEYHTLDMLSDTEQLIKKCRNKREEALVGDFIGLWEKNFNKKKN